ncbi:MAG: sensor histidine kinase, partial [Acidimicrobiales bacterium]
GDRFTDEELRAIVPRSKVPVSVGVTGGSGGGVRTMALSAGGTPVGLLGLRGSSLRAEDSALLLTFANQIALTLERARLREQVLRSELSDKADRLQKALVGAVSHDLRTPLATIKVSASTLRNSEVELGAEDRGELLEVIDAQADRLARLVTNLLNMSRVQAGALKVDRHPVAVVDLVSEALGGLDLLLRPGQVTVGVPDGLPLVDADHVLIEQVLSNLVENAARHAPEGTAIAVDATARPDGLVEIAVADRGPGIPEVERSGVFEMFTRSGPGEGTGVGLSIARAFVEAHGQSIWVEKAPGGGARFCFTLPALSLSSMAP